MVSADGVLVFDEDEDAGEHVLEDGLGAEADAESDDAGGGDEGAEGDAEGSEDLRDEIKADEAIGSGSKDCGHGAELGGALGISYHLVGALDQALGEEIDDRLEDEGEDQGNEDPWDALLNEVTEVGLQPRSTCWRKRSSWATLVVRWGSGAKNTMGSGP